MVFGNMGNDCATGVAFTRNPSKWKQRNLRRVFNQCSRRRRCSWHKNTPIHCKKSQQTFFNKKKIDGSINAKGI